MEEPVLPLDQVTVPLQLFAVSVVVAPTQTVLAAGVISGGATCSSVTVIGAEAGLTQPFTVQVAVKVPAPVESAEPSVPSDHVTSPLQLSANKVVLPPGQMVVPPESNGAATGVSVMVTATEESLIQEVANLPGPVLTEHTAL